MTPKKVVFSVDVDSAVTKTAGKAGSFLEEVLEARQFSIPGGLEAEAFGISLAFPLVFSAGTGVTLSSNNVSFDGSARVEQIVSIGQPVGITDSVTFNQVSASSLTLGSTTYDGGSITGNLIITGSVTTTGNMTVNGNTTITGTLTAQEYHTEFVSASIIYASGSTKFGDTLDDNHNFTGSLLTTGSLSLNDYSVTEISNDILLADSSTTSLVTENAIKTYVDAQTVTKQTYLRKQYFKTNSTIIIPATASFSAVTASAPSGMVATSEHDFIFFINGQYMEHDAIEIEQSGSLFLLQVDNASIGYDLETDDEIIAIGKFNS